MADTSIAITAGSGTAVDTRTESTNGNHRQVIVIGDPATNAGVAPVDATAGLKVDLGADNDVTVTGTVTANLSATDNTVLDNIDTSTAAIKTAVETLDNAIAGSEMQVDVVAALPAGTNNIGDVDVFSNTVKDGSGTRYQPIVDTDGHLQVDVLSGGGGGTQYTEADVDASITGTAILWEDTSDTLRSVSAAKPLPVNIVAGSSSGTEYTEDAAAAADPAGPMSMAVRADTLAAVTSTDSDNIALRATNKGELYVKQTDAVPASQSGTWNITNVSGTVSLPTGASTAANQTTIIGHLDGVEGILTTMDADTGAIMTSVQLIDDAIVADDAAFTPATTKVMMAGFEYDDTSPDSVNEGDAGAARMSANRNLYMQIRDAAGNERGVNVNASNQMSVSVDNTVTVASHAVTNAGTFAVQESGGALTALQIMDDWDNGASDGASVSGDVAHDTADAGEPVKVGFKAYNFDGTAPQTAVAEGDRVNAIANPEGIQYVETAHPRFWHVSADYASAQTNATVKAAPGASLSLYITDISISNGATAGNITLLDGSGGTVLYEIYPAINGGATLNLKNPIRLTANTALCITSTTVTTHAVFVAGFIAA